MDVNFYENRIVILNLRVSSLTNSVPELKYVVAQSHEREHEVKCNNEVAMIECRYWYRLRYTSISTSTSNTVEPIQSSRGSFRSTAVACDASWLLRKGQGSCQEVKKDGIPGVDPLMGSSMQIG